MATAAWYGVYWSGLHIADVVVDINLKGKKYEAQSFLNTGGLIAMFSPMAIYSWSDGVISEQGSLPDYFHYHENDDGDLSQLDLHYDHNLPSLVDAKGKVIPFPATGKRPVVADAKRRGSQNPLSLLIEFCNWAIKADGGSAKSIPVFDGKRLYNINGSIISHDESMVRARFVREPVDGYTKKELRRMGNLVFNLTLDSTNPMLPSDIRGTVLGGDARASLMLTCPDFMSCVKSAHITPPDNFSLALPIAK